MRRDVPHQEGYEIDEEAAVAIKISPISYGVIVDTHQPRQHNKGIPVFFDGWYGERADAERALKYFAARSPGAYVHLVERHVADQPMPAPGERQEMIASLGESLTRTIERMDAAQNKETPEEASGS
jgi:hypothetical protein